MNINHNKLNFISGPVSVFKLEGKINNIEKKIILFGDIHLDPYDQTDCKNYNSITIKQYLHDIFSNTENKIDFFIEKDYIYFYNKTTDNFVGNYLNQIRQMDFSEYKNIRVHTSDMRNVSYKNNFSMKFIHDDLFVKNLFLREKFNPSDFNILEKVLSETNNFINIVISALNSSASDFKKNLDDLEMDDPSFIFIKDIYKLFFKVKNKIIKDSIRSIIKIILKVITKVRSDFNIKFSKFKKEYDNNIILQNESDNTKLFDNFKYTFLDYSSNLITFFSIITDLYTVRRILDKDYSNNIVCYTGDFHTKNLVSILINFFKFEMVNYFSQIDFYDKKEMKNVKSKSYFNKLFTKNYNFPKEIEQCINLSKFKKPLIDLKKSI